MRFDDTLETVLAGDLATPAGIQSVWRQLVDLIGRKRVPADPRALATLHAIRREVPDTVRAASARGLEYGDPPFALVRLFAADMVSISGPILRNARLASSEWISILPELSAAGREVLRARRDLSPAVRNALESFNGSDFVLETGEAQSAPEVVGAPDTGEARADAMDAPVDGGQAEHQEEWAQEAQPAESLPAQSLPVEVAPVAPAGHEAMVETVAAIAAQERDLEETGVEAADAAPVTVPEPQHIARMPFTLVRDPFAEHLLPVADSGLDDVAALPVPMSAHDLIRSAAATRTEERAEPVDVVAPEPVPEAEEAQEGEAGKGETEEPVLFDADTPAPLALDAELSGNTLESQPENTVEAILPVPLFPAPDVAENADAETGIFALSNGAEEEESFPPGLEAAPPAPRTDVPLSLSAGSEIDLHPAEELVSDDASPSEEVRGAILAFAAVESPTMPQWPVDVDAESVEAAPELPTVPVEQGTDIAAGDAHSIAPEPQPEERTLPIGEENIAHQPAPVPVAWPEPTPEPQGGNPPAANDSMFGPIPPFEPESVDNGMEEGVAPAETEETPSAEEQAFVAAPAVSTLFSEQGEQVAGEAGAPLSDMPLHDGLSEDMASQTVEALAPEEGGEAPPPLSDDAPDVFSDAPEPIALTLGEEGSVEALIVAAVDHAADGIVEPVPVPVPVSAPILAMVQIEESEAILPDTNGEEVGAESVETLDSVAEVPADSDVPFETRDEVETPMDAEGEAASGDVPLAHPVVDTSFIDAFAGPPMPVFTPVPAPVDDADYSFVTLAVAGFGAFSRQAASATSPVAVEEDAVVHDAVADLEQADAGATETVAGTDMSEPAGDAVPSEHGVPGEPSASELQVPEETGKAEDTGESPSLQPVMEVQPIAGEIPIADTPVADVPVADVPIAPEDGVATAPEQAPAEQVSPGDGEATSDPLAQEALSAGSAPNEGPFQIAEVVARIDAFWRRQTEHGRDEARPVAHSTGFRFETDAKGVVRWVEGVSRAPLIGLSLDMAGPGASSVDGAALGAFRRRAGFTNARLLIEGDSDAAGEWRITGIPVFDSASGRFTGYRGAARRPRSDECADAPRRAMPNSADSLRQLVHELRTPANAIAGFAEMIETQILGPVPEPYRGRASVIRVQVKELLGAIDDLDLAARIESHALALVPGEVALRPILTTAAEDLAELAEIRGAWIALPVSEHVVRGDRRAVERLIARLMATLVSVSAQGERIGVRMARESDAMVLLAFERPAALTTTLAEASGETMLGVEEEGADATTLGTGFALRLARNLARELGGSLTIDSESITLRLPAAETAAVEPAHLPG